jgi:DHA2 family multidrug resistance protein-like MFS transporter
MAIAIGLAIAAVFIERQRRLEHPLIDLYLFRDKRFTASVATQLVATITFGGLYLIVSQYLQLVLGLSPLHAGMALLPATLSGIAGTFLAPQIVKKIPQSTVMPASMIVSTIGMIALTRITPTTSLVLLVSGYVIMMFAINITMTLTTDMIMTVAPPERAGSASGISETSAELGAALGVAIIGSISTAYYRSELGVTLPSGLPADVSRNAMATIGGAITSAIKVDGTLRASLIDSARDAFTGSLAFVAIVCTILVFATGATVLVVLRKSAPRVELRSEI